MKVNKRKVKKLLAFILSLAIFINFMLMIFKPNIAAAIDYENGGVVDNVATGIGSLLTGLVLVVVSSAIKLPVLLVGYLLKVLMNSIVTIGSGSWVGDISLENILFAGYTGNAKFKTIEVTDVNFFNFNNADDDILAFRTAVAKWYYIMRLIAAAILLVILIYVGIRMAISTIASEQAKYKQMLIDWVTSLALLFLLHYIILFVIQINTSLVNALGSLVKLDNQKRTLGQALNVEIVKDVWLSATSGLIAAIVYCIIQGMVFRYFMFYLKRMITVGFLIIIAPLITITYSIDKMGDGKAQALNTWLKELVYNILIQPFHCVLYLAFFGAIQEMLGTSWVATNLLPYVLTVVILTFMPKAEDILRKIFHFEASSMSSVNEPAQAFMNATGRFAKMGMSAGKAVSNFRAAGGMKALTGGIAQMNAKRQVKKDFKSGKITDEGGNVLTDFSAYKRTDNYKSTVAAEQKRQREEKKEEKREKKARKARQISYNKNGAGDFNNIMEDEARKMFDKENGAGSYDRWKNMASKKDKYGKPTKTAQKAQKKLNDFMNDNYKDIESRAAEKVLSEGTTSRRMITGVKNFGQGAAKTFSNMRESINESELGAAMVGLGKDSIKVASAIAFGATAYGVTSQMNDAFSMGQFGYGLSTGILENTTRTIEEESAGLMAQYAITHGMSAAEMKEFAEELANQCDKENIAGLFKNLGDQFNKMEQSIESMLGDGAADLISKIRIMTTNGDLYDTEQMLKEYMSDNNLNLSDTEQSKALKQLNDASDLAVKSIIAGNFTKLEGTTGIDIDSYGRQVGKKIESTTINNVYDQRKTYSTTYNNSGPNPGGANP